MGPRAGLDRCGKSRLHRDSIPEPSSPQPVAIPTELPGPQNFIKLTLSVQCRQKIIYKYPLNRPKLWTVLTNSTEQSFPEKLTVPQLVNKISAFHATRTLSTAFTSPCPQPNQSSPLLPFLFLKIHSNIILPSTPGSSKWSLSLRFPHPHPVYNTPLPHTRYMLRLSHSS